MIGQEPSNFGHQDSSQKETEVTSANVARFPYLRRGEGTARFGKVTLPRFDNPNPKTTGPPAHPEHMPSHPREGKAPQQRVMTMATVSPLTQDTDGNTQGITPRTTGTDSGCEDSISHSVGETSIRTLSDTKQFEELEERFQNTLSSDTSFRCFVNGAAGLAGSKRRSSPKVVELPEKEREIALDQRQPGGSDKYEGRTAEREMPSPSSSKSSAPSYLPLPAIPELPQQRFALPLPPPQPSAPQRVTHLPPPTHTQSSRTLQPPPQLLQPQQPQQQQQQQQQQNPFWNPPSSSYPSMQFVRGGFPRNQQSQSQSHSPVFCAQQQRAHQDHMSQLISRIAVFDENLSRLRVQEAMVTEFAEKLKRSEAALEQEKENFQQTRNEELDKIKRTEEEVKRKKLMLDKKETEQIKILREQVKDLQHDLCERDAKISAQRTKHRELEQSVPQLNAEIVDLRAEVGRWKDRCRSLEDANAQLRIKLPRSTPPATDKLTSEYLKTRNAKTPTETKEKRVTFQISPRLSDENIGNTKENVGPTMQTDVNSPEVVSPDWRQRQQPSSSIEDDIVIQEKRLPDGSVEKMCKNGTMLTESPDGSTKTWRFSNGDIRRLLSDGTQVYWYAKKDITVVTQLDGTEVVKFASGQEDTHRKDGTVETRFRDGTRRLIEGQVDHIFFTDGSEEFRHPQYILRKFPNGDTKTIYKDKTVVTTLRDGRIRIRDPSGQITLDSSS